VVLAQAENAAEIPAIHSLLTADTIDLAGPAAPITRRGARN
jgi:hypothetical protein